MKKAIAIIFFIMIACNPQTSQTNNTDEIVPQTSTNEVLPQTNSTNEVTATMHLTEDKMANTIIELETTMGKIKLRLHDDKAPITAGNFKKLVEQGYYNGTIFHRVIKNFMIQGGDPTGTGRGGPGYKIKDEFGQGLKHNKKGTLSMANSGPDTGGSQFFITLAPTPWLDGKHAIFGELIEGEDVLDKIGNTPTDAGDRPKQEARITRATVIS